MATLVALAACSESEAPAAPEVQAPAGPVKANPFTLKGKGVAGGSVAARGSMPVATAPIAADGSFSVEVPLAANQKNLVLVSQTNADGLESAAVTLEITHDGVAPAKPALLPVTTPTRLATQTLRGTAESNATVKVVAVEAGAEASAKADASGVFAVEIALKLDAAAPVTNHLEVVAIDAAGNESAKEVAEIVVDTHLAVQAPVLDAPLAVTNRTAWEVKGSAEPGVALTLFGDATASGTAGNDGKFALPVTLLPNTLHTFFVLAIGNGQSSAPATAKVQHDGVAPAAPSLAPPPGSTSAESVELTGHAEPGATVRVGGGAEPASVVAGADGSFAVTVKLGANTDNVLSVTATDAAGNASEASSVTIRHDSSLPPPIYLYSDEPLPTRKQEIVVKGNTAANLALKVGVSGGAEQDVTTAANGTFSVTLALTADTANTIVARRTDRNDVQATLVVEQDSLAPAAPVVNALASPTNEVLQRVTGTTEPGAALRITGGVAVATGIADEAGGFEVEVTIAPNATANLSVVAVDRAGNESAAAAIAVEHRNVAGDAPLLNETAPAPTRNTSYVLSGRLKTAKAGVTITVTGGLAEVTGVATNPTTGAFSATVSLRPNQANALRVVAVEGEVQSPPAAVTVVHDAIAPPRPVVGKIEANFTGFSCLTSTTVTVTGASGAVEANASVLVKDTSSGTSVTVRANSQGAFNTSISSCSDRTLELVATDAAGNASEKATVVVN